MLSISSSAHSSHAVARRVPSGEKGETVTQSIEDLFNGEHSGSDSSELNRQRQAVIDMPAWTSGRVALIGDAAYAASHLTGLGTSLAVVGAYVLAGELAVGGGDHSLAFARYEAELRSYVRQCQELPPGGIGGFLPGSRLAIWGRNLSTKMMARWPFRLALRGVFEKADTIQLRDYHPGLVRPVT